MEDSTIIDLYWQRDEEAIRVTHQKYGPYCRSIADHILSSPQDSEECVSDTYLRAWNAIPPRRPECLRVFLGRITRNLSLDRRKAQSAQRRGQGQVELALEELRDCLASPDTPETHLEEQELSRAIGTFLRQQKPLQRRIFVLRYWYLESQGEIAGQLQLSESKVKSSLYHTRVRLKDFLRKEGIAL